jgi:hypothetical protein
MIVIGNKWFRGINENKPMVYLKIYHLVKLLKITDKL